jgi:DNA ligase (NAD+)
VEIKKRICELREILNYHSHKYYVEDAPEISDYEYDALYRKLEKLEEMIL